MANNELKIIVGGGVAPSLVQSTQQAGKALSDLGSAATRTGTSVENLFDEIAAGDAAMKRVAASIDKNVVESLGAAYRAAGQLEDSFERIPPAVSPAGRGFREVGQEVNKVASGLRNIPPAAGPANSSLAATAAQAAKTGAALKSVPNAANTAGFALTNVGRVAQDLPFGFIGIQNNLNPLLESFQRLRAEAGSNVGALKALGSSLVGPAGIGLALSVVSSIIVIAQNGISGFNKKTKEAADKAKELVDSLRSIGQVTDESGAGVQGEILEIQALARVVTDTNKSYQERKRALEGLKEANKAYFGDLTLESATLKTVTERTEEYTKALIAQAVVKGFKDEISRVSVELAKQQGILNQSANEVNRLRAAFENTKQSETSLTGEDRVSQKYIDAGKAVKVAEEEFRKQNATLQQVKANFDQLAFGLTAAVEETGKFKALTTASTKANKDEEDALRKRADALKTLEGETGLSRAQRNELLQLEIQILFRDGAKEGFKPEEIKDRVQQLINDAQDKLSRTPPELKVSTKITLDTPTIDVGGAVGGQISSTAFDSIINAIRENAALKLSLLQIEFTNSIKEALVNGAIDGLTSVGDTIGAAIAGIFNGQGFGAALAAGAQNLLSIIGGVLQEIGKKVVVTSTLIKALRATLDKLFTPGGASAGIGAGLALIAFGSLLKNVKFNIPGFAEGVNNFSGGLALVGERGPELVRLPGNSDVIPNNIAFGGNGGPVQVVGVIRGEDIYLANNRTANRRRRI